MTTTLLVIGDGDRAQEAVGEINENATPTVRVHSFANAADLAQWAGPGADATAAALVVLVPNADENVDDLIESVLAHPACEDPRILLVTDRPHLDDLSRALDRRSVAGIVAAPWTPGSLAGYAHAEVSRWLRLHPQGEAVPEQPPVGSDLLRHLGLPLDRATHELLDVLEEALGPRPRIHLPAGVRITREDLDIDQIFLVVSGKVSLAVTSRTAGRVTLNHATTGPIIGLLALTDRHGSMVTARTTTACEVVQLTLEQLDKALAADPRVGAILTALSFRTLSARLRHAQSERVKKTELTRKLQQALNELRQARADLIAQARMATLGELAAGIAHELNNPVATVSRSAEHLADDLPRLLADDPVSLGVLEQARAHVPMDARGEREARRAVMEVVGDPVLARRLVAAGITDPDQARRLTKGQDAGALERVELVAGMAGALQSLDLAAAHIGALVDELRQHARPDGSEPAHHPTSVHETVRSALLLLGHRLRDVEVSVEAEPDLPPVLANPADLVQVWTNLATNAVDAMDESGTLTIRIGQVTDERDVTWVRVEVEDNGPGVPEELQAHLFEPRFTTKHGVVRFGLGLGLSIAHTIIQAHSGTIGLESRPGRTCFDVRLPAAQEETS